MRSEKHNKDPDDEIRNHDTWIPQEIVESAGNNDNWIENTTQIDNWEFKTVDLRLKNNDEGNIPKEFTENDKLRSEKMVARHLQDVQINESGQGSSRSNNKQYSSSLNTSCYNLRNKKRRNYNEGSPLRKRRNKTVSIKINLLCSRWIMEFNFSYIYIYIIYRFHKYPYHHHRHYQYLLHHHHYLA